MSRRRLTLLFVAALALMLVVLLPLRLALGWIGFDRHGIAAIDATGSIWNGRLRNAVWRGRSLGDMEVSLRPLSLLTGVRGIDFSTRELSGSLSSGRIDGVERVNGEVVLERIESMPGLSLRIMLRDVALLFGDRRCAKAAGQVAIDASFAGLDTPIRLQGAPACDGEYARVELVSTGTPRIDATLQFDADGRYRVHTRVDDADPATALGLQVAGFQRTPSGLGRVDEGNVIDP